jgi:hypothetical protein
MSIFTHFSKHAVDRVDLRTSLSSAEVSRLLDNGVYVNTGKYPVFNREHLLFYSNVDNACFVAVRDCISGTVVTILPLTYQSNLAWKISEQDQLAAQKLWQEFEETCNNKQELVSVPKNFHVYVQYVNDQNKVKTLKVFSVLGTEFDGEIDQLYSSDIFTKRLGEIGITAQEPIKEVISLKIKKGAKGQPFFIPL